mgnify:CR=1 FL=1
MGFRRLPFFVMNSILQRHIVLDVTRLQQAIGTRTVGEAIVAMTGDNGMKPPAQSFDIEYGRRADGSYDMKEVLDRRPVGWAEWITLPVRPFDLAIRTARGEIRAPTVIMAPEYWNMPVSRPKLNAKAIKERDGYVCQYTGRKLRPDEANLDHVVPLDRGGKSTWANLVCSDARVNSLKGNRLPHEAGLRLIRKPLAPREVPRCATIRVANHESWWGFLIYPDALLVAA